MIAIDPGNRSGFAEESWGVVTRAYETTIDNPPPMLTASGVGIIELPQIYPSARSKGNPNDLIKVAYNAGRWHQWLVSHGYTVGFILPKAWKGSIPKEMLHERIERGQIRGPLSRAELALFRAVGPNAKDAFALLLWKMGRLR